MKLADWLKARRATMTIRQFAVAIDTSESTVYRWTSGEHVPQPRHMKRIAKVTGGAVRPSDFFDVAQHQAPAPQPAEAAA